MPTIQIRNVPDSVHRIYRVRAAASGMSLQEYLLAELQRNATRRDPSDLVAESESRIREDGREGFASVSAATVVRRDRAEH